MNLYAENSFAVPALNGPEGVGDTVPLHITPSPMPGPSILIAVSVPAPPCLTPFLHTPGCGRPCSDEMNNGK